MTAAASPRRTVAADEGRKQSTDNKVRFHRAAPARYRACALDAEDSVPAEDFRYLRKKPVPLVTRQGANASASAKRRGRDREREQRRPGELAKPNPDCAAASGSRTGGEWAVLTTYEAHQANDLYREEQRRRVEAVRRLRAGLDEQMGERQQLEAREAELREADRRMVDAAMVRDAHEEAASSAKQRQAKHDLKAGREAQVQRERILKASQQQRRREEDKAELQQLQKDLDAEQVAKEEHRSRLRAEADRTKVQNEQRIQEKRRQLEQERREDRELMEETIRTVEAQDAARAAALTEFRTQIARRSELAGVMAVEEAADREQEEETRLLRQEQQAQAAAEAEVQRRADAARRRRAEDDRARAYQMQLKADRAEQKRAELVEYVEQVKLKDQRTKAEEARKAELARLAVVDTKRHVKTQMDERAAEKRRGDAHMTAAERAYNRKLLHDAKLVVSKPQGVPLLM